MGAPDENGIYQYTENEDEAAPFSDLLNLLAGSTSDEIANDRARLDALEARGAESTYVPALTNAVLGNGTVAGRWAKAGSLTFWHWIFTLGSSSTVANGFTVSIPVAATSGMLVLGFGYVGRGTSVTGRVTTIMRLTSGNVVWPWYDGGAVGAASPLSGGTWQAGDVIAGAGVYLS
jgi:hypothetical protein